MNASVKNARQLESFIAGEWVRGAGKASPLLDAATGEEVAQIDGQRPRSEVRAELLAAKPAGRRYARQASMSGP